MEGLRVDMHRLPQLWQRLAARLSQQTEMEGGELLEVPHVVEQAAIVGAVLVNEGHRRGGGAHAGHGDTSLQRSRPAYGVPDVTDEGLAGKSATAKRCGTVQYTVRGRFVTLDR